MFVCKINNPEANIHLRAIPLIYVYAKRKALLVQLEDSVLTVHLGNLSITDLFYIKTLIVGGLSMRGLGLAIVLIATGSD